MATIQSTSACDAGNAFACFDHAPTTDTADPLVAYAFAATPGTDPRGTCGTCFEVTFPGPGYYSASDPGSAALHAQSKVLYLQATNIGYDVHANQFDIMIPGGGVGLFDACTSQWQASSRGIDLGAQYGGFLTQCQQSLGYADHAALKVCVRGKCDQVFDGQPGLEPMLAGCRWFVDWYELADNPTIDFAPVNCPAYFSNALSGTNFGRLAQHYLVTNSLPPPSILPTSVLPPLTLSPPLALRPLSPPTGTPVLSPATPPSASVAAGLSGTAVPESVLFSLIVLAVVLVACAVGFYALRRGACEGRHLPCMGSAGFGLHIESASSGQAGAGEAAGDQKSEAAAGGSHGAAGTTAATTRERAPTQMMFVPEVGWMTATAAKRLGKKGHKGDRWQAAALASAYEVAYQGARSAPLQHSAL